MQGNVRGMQGNVRGMQGNARGTYGSGCKVPEECSEMPGQRKGVGVKNERNARECRMQNARGTYGSGCKMPGGCRRIEGNVRGTYGSGRSARGMQGNAGECQGNVWVCVEHARRMQGNIW